MQHLRKPPLPAGVPGPPTHPPKVTPHYTNPKSSELVARPLPSTPSALGKPLERPFLAPALFRLWSELVRLSVCSCSSFQTRHIPTVDCCVLIVDRSHRVLHLYQPEVTLTPSISPPGTLLFRTFDPSTCHPNFTISRTSSQSLPAVSNRHRRTSIWMNGSGIDSGSFGGKLSKWANSGSTQPSHSSTACSLRRPNRILPTTRSVFLALFSILLVIAGG